MRQAWYTLERISGGRWLALQVIILLEMTLERREFGATKKIGNFLKEKEPRQDIVSCCLPKIRYSSLFLM